MNFHQLLDNLFTDTLGSETFAGSLWAFRPELILCVTIVAMLLARMLDGGRYVQARHVMIVGTAAALYFAAPWHFLAPDGWNRAVPIFTGLLVFDNFAIYMRGLLLLFALLFAGLTIFSRIPARDDGTEFYTLILGATLGMCLMVSANHMLIVFLGVEMASVPMYALSGFLRHRRSSSEAALKFAVYGAGTAGVMLYGISLLVGVLGSAHLPTMATRLAEMLQNGAVADRQVVLVLGAMMVMVGLAFKLSAVPFHFWAPDVFEGTTAEVGAFLSIASKAAALALLVRVATAFGFVSDGAMAAALEPARMVIAGLIALLAAITCTFGNLAAYGQTNMKRLLAYSTIAHAGYMMMPVAAAVALAGSDPAAARAAIAALGFYIAIYLFMNLGAFAAVAFLRNVLGSEQIDDYAGLIRRSPGLAICLSVILFSLVGLPPLAGFAAKFTIFASLLDAGLLGLLVIGGLNTVLSLFYYLRVVKVMTFNPEPDYRTAPTIPLVRSVEGAYCLVMAVPLLVLGIWWNGLYVWAEAAASTLLL